MKSIKRVSRWISIQNLDVTEKHSLYYYGEDIEDSKKRSVMAFRYNGRWYAVNQFIARFGMYGFDVNCKDYPSFISGYDGDGNIYNPLMCELDEYGEKIRLYINE